jgi:formyltetrahydrofolate synthetase
MKLLPSRSTRSNSWWLVHAGTPLPHAYLSPDVELVTAGCANLARHIENTRKYGVPVVVAINAFASDSTGEEAR